MERQTLKTREDLLKSIKTAYQKKQTKIEEIHLRWNAQPVAFAQ